jgi:hypothetical protein
MKRTLGFCLTAVLLLSTVHRAPAPILEESPTPAPEQSAKPKPKRTIKPKVTSESSESSTKRPTSSPQQKAQGTPKLERLPGSRFAGPWVGNMPPTFPNVTLVFNASVTSVTVTSAWTNPHAVTCDGKTATFQTGLLNEHSWTFTPNSDGKTALATMNTSTATFSRP